MDGLIHPTGEESQQTYWVRRGVVLAVLVLLVIAVVMMVNGFASASNRQAQPAAAPVSTPTADPSQPTEEPSAGAQPSPGATTAATAAPGAPSAPATPAASATPAAPTASSTPGSTSTFLPAPAPSAGAPAPQAQPANAICDGAAMKVEVTSPNQIKAGVPVRHLVKVTNTSQADCRVEVNQNTFELKVYSGNDRISSTADCSSALLDKAGQLASNHSMEFQLEWGVNRSVAGCRLNPEQLKPGTYVTTAQLKGAKPAQSVMQLA